MMYSKYHLKVFKRNEIWCMGFTWIQTPYKKFNNTPFHMNDTFIRIDVSYIKNILNYYNACSWKNVWNGLKFYDEIYSHEHAFLEIIPSFLVDVKKKLDHLLNHVSVSRYFQNFQSYLYYFHQENVKWEWPMKFCKSIEIQCQICCDFILIILMVIWVSHIYLYTYLLVLTYHVGVTLLNQISTSLHIVYTRKMLHFEIIII